MSYSQGWGNQTKIHLSLTHTGLSKKRLILIQQEINILMTQDLILAYFSILMSSFTTPLPFVFQFLKQPQILFFTVRAFEPGPSTLILL